MNFKIGLLGLMLSSLSVSNLYADDWKDLLRMESDYWQSTAIDTIPLIDRDGDFTTEDYQNPFDLLPSDTEQTIEYDADSDTYIISEKIGDEYLTMPSYMTFDEYLTWKSEQSDQEYFNKLSGIGDNSRGKSGLLDPMSKINIKDSLKDRLFGGNEVTIKPQGTIDVAIGVQYNFVNNGNNPARRIDRWAMLFEPKIKMNVDGNIGDKMDLGFNYDTQSTFDSDRKIKLAYDSEEFTEDDIIKKIEAGNVSLPLRSSLISGSQSLFGLKTDLQFGHLKVTALASQQKSKPKKLSIQNGAQIQEFELRPADYDENRHFFISHYHREAYEEALSNLPHVLSAFTIANIEVWISDDRPDFDENSTQIVGIVDIGNPEEDKFSNPDADYFIDQAFFPPLNLDVNGVRMPDNKSNSLMDELETDAFTRQMTNANASLRTTYNMQETRDFEQFKGRMLRPNEFTFNPELGFISLNIRLQPNQQLAVSYEYFYTQNCDEVYRVGELATDSQIASTDSTGVAQPETVIFSKLLKSSNQSITHPTWDLMMKNIYALRTNNLSPKDFRFDIFYEDDLDGGQLKKFIPPFGTFDKSNEPLLNVFNLDQLNSINDPQPDGVFDFVPGVTVIPRIGAIIFPTLEPFGSTLREWGAPDFFIYDSLYTNTVTIAELDLTKSKFIMKGEYKSDSSAEIQLGSWNIPQGSVTVRAGGKVLIEGQDYEVDYGIGRLRILNEAYLQQGVPLDIQLEDNSLFSLQQKSMLGLRADYEFTKNFSIGGTYLRLSERPFTQKVNVGDDPINNRVIGFDMVYQKEAPWVTKIIDKLPLYSTNAESSVSFNAEVAALKPGHRRVINLEDENEGVVNIDDFEGAVTGLPMGSSPFAWNLASVPVEYGPSPQWPEAFREGTESGVNRAMLNWYIADINVRSSEDNDNAYTRGVLQRDLFNRDIPINARQDLFTFDMIYDPTLRGPYNFDLPDGIDGISEGFDTFDEELGIILNNPETRWAGVMRYLNTNDFQAANYEFIEFWLLNPFMEQEGYNNEIITPQDPFEEGKLTFHLGSISEDILKDGVQFYENGVQIVNNTVAEQETAFGTIPLTPPVTGSFDITTKEQQDVGLDGINSLEERVKHEDWLNSVENALTTTPLQVQEDPANDDFAFFGDSDVFDDMDNLNTKYRLFSNSENNSPDIQGSGTNVSQSLFNTNVRGKFEPDREDLNGNNSLDQSENYYKYEVQINNDGNNEIDQTATPYITDVVTVERGSNGADEKWYRFQIPIQDISNDQIEGDIQGFRSIQFMRMIVNEFSSRKILRMAEFELVRSQWRRDLVVCNGEFGASSVEFNLDTRGIEENGNKEPFGYVIPPDVQQEQIFNSISSNALNERALSMNFRSLGPDCEISMNKLLDMDLRLFKRLQLFVHAEESIEQAYLDGIGTDTIKDNDLELFVRFGKDYENNYYEYRIPLSMTKDNNLSRATPPEYQDSVWREDNLMDVTITDLVDLKRERNALGFPVTEEYIKEDYNTFGHEIRVIGNPTFGLVKGIQIGITNTREDGTEDVDGEVWVNELRAIGFDEEPSVAALARLDVQLADLGNLSVSGQYSSIGWGSLDQRMLERNREELIDYDVATNLELGKFLPSKWNVRIPFYAQYLKSISNPQFHPFDSDVLVRDKIAAADTPQERAAVRAESQDVTTIRTFNFTNVKKERSTKPINRKDGKSNKTEVGKATPPKVDGGTDLDEKAIAKAEKKAARKAAPPKPMPWDISNFSASYGYTETDRRDPLLEFDNSKEYRGGLDYIYSRKVNYITPFKSIKSKHLAILKQFNFNPFPNSFGFNTTLDKTFKQRKFRLPNTKAFQFDEKSFVWTRQYDLKWDFTKALNMRFNASNQSFVDELRQVGIEDIAEQRDWQDEQGEIRTNEVNQDAEFVQDYWMNNLQNGGRNRSYDHQLSLTYTLPIRYLPLMDWITVKTQYKADYTWAAGQLITIDQEGNQPGAIIKNNQNRSVNATLDFKKLYNKSKYIKSLDKSGKSNERESRSSRSDRSRDALNPKSDIADKTDADKAVVKDRTKKSDGPRQPSGIEKFLLRPIFSLRTAKLSYREDLSTLVPGFLDTPQFFGLSEGFSSPGWQFVAGLQPDITKSNNNDNWLYQNQQWFNTSKVLNKQIMQDSRQTLEADFAFEPWKDVDIDVEFYKKTSRNHSEEFTFLDKDGVEGFRQQALYDVGSVEFSYYTLNTLFGNRSIELFNTLRDNRAIVSQRIGIDREGGQHEIDGNEYAKGLGKLNNDVVVPSFIAAYTGQDPTEVNLDIIQETSQWNYLPKPNWSLNYRGLNKLPMFKNIFKTINIKHGYKSVFGINRYNSDPQYDALSNQGNLNEIKVASGNYFTRWEIPSIQINEQFSPIIGIDLQTQNNINLNFEYKKSRQLELYTTVAELNEQLSTEFVFGAGFQFEDVNIGFLTGEKKNKKKRSRTQSASQKAGGLASVLDTGDANFKRKLICDISMSFADNITYAHDLRNDVLNPLAVRGTKQFRISPSIEYDINKNLSLRWYSEYGRTTPWVTPPFPVTNFETAFVVRFKLN